MPRVRAQADRDPGHAAPPAPARGLAGRGGLREQQLQPPGGGRQQPPARVLPHPLPAGHPRHLAPHQDQGGQGAICSRGWHYAVYLL